MVALALTVCQNPGFAFRTNAAMPGSDNGNPISGAWLSKRKPLSGDPKVPCSWRLDLLAVHMDGPADSTPAILLLREIRGVGETFLHPCQGLQSSHKTSLSHCILEIPRLA